MKLNFHCELEGRFTLRKCKLDSEGNEIAGTGEVVADWFDNMILNSGLDLIATTWGYCNNIVVGSGTGEVLPGQTALQNQIAFSDKTQSDTRGAQIDELPYYGWRRITKRFNAGFGGGNVNISEVGALPNAGYFNNLFSRALVRDAMGNPTVIPILADETLDVTYEVRSYPASSDATGTIVLKGISRDYTIRSMSMHNGGSFTQGIGEPIFASDYDNWRFNVIANGGVGLGPITRSKNDINNAAFPNVYSALISTLVGGYSSGNYYRDIQTAIDLGDGNWANGIGTIGISYGPGAFQIYFDPPPVKTNTEKFTFVTRVSWGRKVI